MRLLKNLPAVPVRLPAAFLAAGLAGQEKGFFRGSQGSNYHPVRSLTGHDTGDARASQPSRTQIPLQIIEPQDTAARGCRLIYRNGDGLTVLRDHQHVVRQHRDGLAGCTGLSGG